MDTVKLFSEAVEEVQYITEEKEDGGKNYKIKGIFMQADVKNRNGRVYPFEVLQKEGCDKIFQEKSSGASRENKTIEYNKQ